MNRLEAKSILDAARDGADVSEHRITQALRVTGDLEDVSIVIVRPAGTWERGARQLLRPAEWTDALWAA